MKTQIRTGWLLALAFLLTTGLSCTNAENDETAQWLLGLADADTSQTTSTSTSADTSSTGTDTTTTTSTGTDTSVTSTETATSTSTSETSVEFQIQTSLLAGDDTFIFDNTRVIELQVLAQDAFGETSDTAIVRVVDTETMSYVYYTAKTDENGNVSGTFTVDQNTNQVYLEIIVDGETFYRLITIDSVDYLNARILIYFSSEEYTPEPDTDGDGIVDSLDAYPEDATRASTVQLPIGGGYYTVAYEDLYPKPGDMDFNDYVVRVRYEQDLDAYGQVSRVRGYFTHIARGAGYTHTLNLLLPQSELMTYHLVRTDYAGEIESETDGTGVADTAVEILPKSSTTIQSANTSSSASSYVMGKQAMIEVTYGTPISGDEFGTAPFDLYLYVNNTKQEIHFAGRYADTDGDDPYLDSNGFPWAFLIPGDWDWPYESGDIHDAYPLFDDWYLSSGTTNKDWYLTPVENLVVPFSSTMN